MFKSSSKPSQVFRTIFPCRLTAQHKKKKRKQSSTAKSSSGNDKISFASLNEKENDLYWSEEPLKDHPDAEDKKHVSLAGSFPYALGFGDLGRKSKRQKKNGNTNNNHGQHVTRTASANVAGIATPATVVATPSEESTSWAAEFNRRFPSPSTANDETRWIDAAVDKTNNAFSAQKPQHVHGSNVANVAQQDMIGEMHQHHATLSDSEEDMFDASAVRVEPKRRLFGASSGGDAPSFASPSGVMDTDGNVVVDSSAIMGANANAAFNAASSQGSAIANATPSCPEPFTPSFPIQAISPSQRDTLPKSSTRKTREQQRQRRTARRNRRRQRHKDLVEVVSKISEKCSELQINLAEKEADIEKLRGSHEALLRDLEQTGKSPAFASNASDSHMGIGSSAGGAINSDGTSFAHAYNSVGNDEERKVLQTTLAANAKLELALKAMQNTAQEARKTLDRTKKDQKVEINQLRRTHEIALNEQRGAYTKTLRGMQEQLTTVTQQVQHLQNRNYDLEMQLDCAKAALQEEATQRAQENLNHVYEMMDLTRDHEARVAELKKEKTVLAEQVEEGYLNMDEMRMSLELVKADADYASAKLERTKRAHRDEIRSLAQESDDRFFNMMAARERECLGMNQELNGMFGGGFGSMPGDISKSSSKFD